MDQSIASIPENHILKHFRLLFPLPLKNTSIYFVNILRSHTHTEKHVCAQYTYIYLLIMQIYHCYKLFSSEEHTFNKNIKFSVCDLIFMIELNII